MIRLLKTGRGAFAKFGDGTVRIYSYLLKGRYGGQVELTSCVKTKTGANVPDDKVLEGTNKIVLDFGSIEALDLFIKKLQSLKEDMHDV